MTQDRYLSRGRIHPQVADLLDRTIGINDDSQKLILKNPLPWGGWGSNPRPTDYESAALTN